MSHLRFLNPFKQVNRKHNNKSTIIYFTDVNENLTEFIKVLLVKLSDMFDSSISSDFYTVKVLHYTIY